LQVADQESKKTQETNDKTTKVLQSDLPGMQQAVAELAKAQTELVGSLSEAFSRNAEETRALVSQLMAATTAKRKRTPRRGADGRIVEVMDEVAG
jgi:septal ring factor EnvC (AmiA/AmiB activator)